MKSLIKIAICCSLSSLALADFTLFGLLSDKSQTHIKERVPSDTPFLVAGELDPDVNFPDNSPTQNASELRELLATELSPHIASAIEILLTRTANAIYMPEARPGISMQKDSFVALYTDGLHPVMRYEFAEDGDLEATLAEADFSSVQAIEGYQVYRLDLEGSSEDISVDVAFNEHEVVWTLGLTNRVDDRLREILIAKPDSLADSDRLDQLYSFEDFDSLAGEINFRLFADQFWAGSNGKLGQDLISIGALTPTDFRDPDFLACEQDMKAMIAGMPRLVAGTTELSQDESATLGVLEFADGDLLAQLALLQGQIPDYQGGIFSMGFGWDMSNIAPVLSNISSRFTRQPYQCEVLEDIRRDFDNQMLATVASGTSFLQGLNGVFFNLDQVEPLKSGQYQVSGSLTLVGENLGNILAPLGMFAPTQIPVLSEANPTGEVVIPANPILANDKLNLTLTDDRLVIDFGDQNSASEVLEAPLLDGLNSVYIDHQKTADLLDTIVRTVPINDAGACYEIIQLREQVERLGSYSESLVEVSDIGITAVSRTTGRGEPSGTISDQFAGDYRVEELTDNCAWVPAGSETLEENGRGLYENGEYMQRYQWQQQGTQLSFSDLEICEGGECEQTQQQDTCTIVNRTAESFDCVYEGSPVFILRYHQQ